MQAEMDRLRNAERELDQYTSWVDDRFYWATIVGKLKDALQSAEADQEQALKTNNVGREVKAGVWIDKLIPIPPGQVFPGAPPPAAAAVNPAEAAAAAS